MNRYPHDVPLLRYRRFGGGYRREDVEASFSRLVSTVGAVEAALDELRVRSEELEEELRERDQELAAYRQREDRLDAALQRVEDVFARITGRERESD